MSRFPAAPPRHRAFRDIPPSQRHDGSLDGYRRQRRKLVQRRRPDEAAPAPSESGRTR